MEAIILVYPEPRTLAEVKKKGRFTSERQKLHTKKALEATPAVSTADELMASVLCYTALHGVFGDKEGDETWYSMLVILK